MRVITAIGYLIAIIFVTMVVHFIWGNTTTRNGGSLAELHHIEKIDILNVVKEEYPCIMTCGK